ncbi:MAG: heat-inducible transcriptional repressor HrcA, partial [Alphaproteobacteria bacterium]
EEALAEATSMLSGLADCAGLVFAPKSETPLKHIEFVGLTDGQALVVMVGENGVVENRLIAVPVGIPPSALVEARNFLSARLVGRTLTEARAEIAAELKEHRVQLDQLTTEVVETGLATWAGESQSGYLIVKGQAKLLENITAIEDLEQIRTLFQALETKETMARLLELAHDAEGVQIFIGADNALFALAGCSMVVAPFANSSEKIVGAIGVIGPTRINYARIIPMVDYTAKVISRVIG